MSAAEVTEISKKIDAQTVALAAELSGLRVQAEQAARAARIVNSNLGPFIHGQSTFSGSFAVAFNQLITAVNSVGVLVARIAKKIGA